VPKVFAVQKQPNHDISHATNFGNIEVLIPFKDISFEAPEVIISLREKLADLQEDDFLLLVGDPFAIGLAMAVASEICAKFQVLKWNRRKFEYYPITVDFEEEED
jgi:hypothetical protein